MLGVYVHVPVACFRKGMARELFETHPLPPPSTCYGFLLSLVGETRRERHRGCRVTAVLLGRPVISAVLRTLWRVKNLGSKEYPLGPGQNPPAHYPKSVRNKGGNLTPGHQQLLTHVELVLWLDSTDEHEAASGPTLEQRVAVALDPAQRGGVDRFGGLSLGESTHLVDEVSPLTDPLRQRLLSRFAAVDERRIFLRAEAGRMDLPVWVDHVGSRGTRSVTGELTQTTLEPPDRQAVPRIDDR